MTKPARWLLVIKQIQSISRAKLDKLINTVSTLAQCTAFLINKVKWARFEKEPFSSCRHRHHPMFITRAAVHLHWVTPVSMHYYVYARLCVNTARFTYCYAYALLCVCAQCTCIALLCLYALWSICIAMRMHCNAYTLLCLCNSKRV